MLHQLHHQNKANLNKTEFVAQIDVNNLKPYTNYNEWVKDVQKRFPPKEGFCWLVCNEESKYFLWAAS